MFTVKEKIFEPTTEKTITYQLFKARLAPSPDGIVHGIKLAMGYERFLITKVFEHHIISYYGDFDEDIMSEGTYLSWSKNCIEKEGEEANEFRPCGEEEKDPEKRGEAGKDPEKRGDTIEVGEEVYLLNDRKKIFKARLDPSPNGIVNGIKIALGYERFLITKIFEHLTPYYSKFDSDIMKEGTFISWKILSTERLKKNIPSNEKKLFEKDDAVNIFHVGLHLGHGVVSSIQDKKAFVKVTKTYQHNIENVPMDLFVGTEVLWALDKLELRDNLPKKKRKESTDKRQVAQKESKKRKKDENLQIPMKDCKCPLKCVNKIPEDQRERHREQYWELECPSDQNSYLSNFIERKTKKISTVGSNKRKYTVLNFLYNEDKENVQVCKTFFLNTFGISAKRRRIVTDKKYDDVSDETGESHRFDHKQKGKKNTAKQLPQHKIDKIKDHIMDFPVVPSHYCRQSSKKYYFESNLTPTKMYRLFQKKYGDTFVSKTPFLKILNQYDVAFFKPKKDLCSACTKKRFTDEDEEKYQAHIDRKNKSREDHDNDTQSAENDAHHAVIIGDLAAVDSCPVSDSGDFYYVTKLACYNFSVFNLGDKCRYAIRWDQLKAKRGSNEISSCLCHVGLEVMQPNITKLTVWADSCGGQNRNKIVTTAAKQLFAW